MPLVPLFLNFSLMIAVPLVLGWYIARRRAITWRFFIIGGATFILAQLVHIPFNYLIFNNWLDEVALPSQNTMLLLTAVFLGTSAALFEEGARYLSYRFWAKDARTWGKGLMMGAGHGGAESILLGVLGALNVVILMSYQAGHLQALVPAEQAPQVGSTLEQLASLPWYELMFGALERTFVLAIQLALSLMVMQVLTRKHLRWLLFAFAWHALIDAVVVIAADVGGTYAAEAITGLAALISLVIIFGLREPEPQAVLPAPLDEPQGAEPIQIEVSREKLEESRFL